MDSSSISCVTVVAEAPVSTTKADGRPLPSATGAKKWLPMTGSRSDRASPDAAAGAAPDSADSMVMRWPSK